MFGRLILQYWSVGGRLRDAGNVYRLCIHSCSPKIGNVRNQIQLNGYRIFHSSISRNENCMSKFSSLQRLSIGLLSATGVQLLVFKTTYCRATLNPDVRLKSCIKETDIKFDWRKFWSMIRPYIWHLLAAVGSALVVAVVNIRIPSVLGHIINVVTNLIGSKMDHSTLRQQMIEPAIQLLSLYGAQALFTFLYIYLLSCVGERVAASMKLELFSSILRQDLVFFDTHRTGDILSRLTVDVQDFKSSLKLCISQGIRSIAQILGCSVSLFFISPEMAGGMLVVVPAVIWVGTVLGSLLRSISTAAQTQAGKATLVSDQAIGSIRTVRAFAMEEAEYEMFAREVNESCHLNERLGFGIGLFQAGTNIFLNGLILGTLYVGGRLMAANQLSAGDLMAFLVATQTIQRSLAQLSLLYGHVMKGMAAGGRIFSLINLEPQMPITGGKKIPYHSMLGDVKFNDVTFAYPTRPQQKILENFFLHLAPGTTVAVVGSSGNGKSTIAALLERFYDVDDGSITIDDIDIRELDPTWLRGTAIGFINQEPILFAGSIMDNIRYGKRDATDEEVIEVAKLANADDFIRKFPDGYDTVVGERGVTISGGQKQRIAIARALIKNPSILVLDEATSALDAESEKIVQDALDRLTRGRTVLVIAHRLSTVRNADLIVVLSNGEIVEMGTHEDLTQKKGFYWSLFWQQQLHEPPRSSA